VRVATPVAVSGPSGALGIRPRAVRPALSDPGARHRADCDCSGSVVR
jgi:hypothetical protein